MAFVGMKHVVAAPIKMETKGQAVTYDTGVVVGGAISATINLTRNSEGLYVDDALKESDNSVTGGTIDINTDDVSDDAAEKVLGFQKTAGTGDGESATPTVFHETGDAAPYCGLGYYRVKRLKGVESFRAYWYHKVQLAINNETANTKTGSITWQTLTLNGNIMAVVNDSNGKNKFRDYADFTDESKAIAWLDGKANIASA